MAGWIRGQGTSDPEGWLYSKSDHLKHTLRFPPKLTLLAQAGLTLWGLPKRNVILHHTPRRWVTTCGAGTAYFLKALQVALMCTSHQEPYWKWLYCILKKKNFFYNPPEILWQGLSNKFDMWNSRQLRHYGTHLLSFDNFWYYSENAPLLMTFSLERAQWRWWGGWNFVSDNKFPSIASPRNLFWWLFEISCPHLQKNGGFPGASEVGLASEIPKDTLCPAVSSAQLSSLLCHCCLQLSCAALVPETRLSSGLSSALSSFLPCFQLPHLDLWPCPDIRVWFSECAWLPFKVWALNLQLWHHPVVWEMQVLRPCPDLLKSLSAS